VTYLKDAGLDVDTTDAGGALDKAIDDQPDVIVVDFCVGDGEVVISQLKRHDCTKHIPIVALVEQGW
jgi:CheY-like chemotaxis protein